MCGVSRPSHGSRKKPSLGGSPEKEKKLLLSRAKARNAERARKTPDRSARASLRPARTSVCTLSARPSPPLASAGSPARAPAWAHSRSRRRPPWPGLFSVDNSRLVDRQTDRQTERHGTRRGSGEQQRPSHRSRCDHSMDMPPWQAMTRFPHSLTDATVTAAANCAHSTPSCALLACANTHPREERCQHAPSQRPLWRACAGPAAKKASTCQTPPLCSQMTRMVPRRGHHVMRTPARKNFSCTPGLRPLLLAHAENRLAQNCSKTCPTTLFALVVGDCGTLSPCTSLSELAPSRYTPHPFDPGTTMAPKSESLWVLCGHGPSASLLRTHPHATAKRSQAVPEPGYIIHDAPSSPQLHSGTRIASLHHTLSLLRPHHSSWTGIQCYESTSLCLLIANPSPPWNQLAA